MWLDMHPSGLACVFCVVAFCALLLQISAVSGEVGDYTHEWAVQIEGGDDEAQSVASDQGYDLVDKVFHDVYVFRHRRLAKRSLRPSVHHHRALHKHPKVSWAEQQRVRRRVKRDFMDEDLHHLEGGDVGRHYRQDQAYNIPTTILDDPQWPQMWYLNRGLGLDMRVQEAWAAGVTGKGVVATILDDGLEKGHPDIIKNYDPDASYDVNNRDKDPVPRYDLIDTNRHGTRCAGEVAADANNSVCAVGVAYGASIGGVRMLDGDVTDAVEARSLALNPQHIHIYSASWGPDDDGKTVDGPGELATRAFIEGINNGRNGLGSLFIWASGNGGRAQDNCNCDGYTNAIWTLSISSATERGNVPWYSEACSSTLATTYSSGSPGERKIITTDLHHECTTSHTGTSASAPLAAGIVALALEVNRNMTWRDMQHIVVRTARPDNLFTPDWQTNGVGRKVSHRFGYGLMDAYAMVQLARSWISVAPQRSCEVQAPHDDKLIPQKSFVTLKLEVSSCPGVQHLEHVQALVSLSADRRGDLEIYLVSPAGTKSTLLALRPHDNSRAGFHSWPFMSVHMWGEKPLGIWILEIHNNGHFYSNDKVELKDFTLVLHGTDVEPGQPTPNYGSDKFPQSSLSTVSSNHLTHQDLTQHLDHSGVSTSTGSREGSKDSNNQRHYPDYNARHPSDSDVPPHSGRDQGGGGSNNYQQRQNQQAGVELGNEVARASGSAAPRPLSVSTLMGQGASVKKAGVEDHLPVTIKLSIPEQEALPPGCITMDPSTSGCIECSLGYGMHHSTCVRTCPDGHYAISNHSAAREANTTNSRSGSHDGASSTNEGGSRAVNAANSSTGSNAGSHPEFTCRKCHYSCKKCRGDEAGHCTVCWPDATLSTPSEHQTGYCYAPALARAFNVPSGLSAPGVALVVLVCAAVTALACVVMCVCCSRTHGDHDPSSAAVSNGGYAAANTATFLSEGVDKFREFKNGVKNGLGGGKKPGGAGMGASYRKLSDDTEKLVTSSRPFYDYSSSSEDEVL